MKGSVSVVIPTFNGRGLLKEHLPSVLEACDAYGRDTEIIVVDDGSTDGTVRWLGERFPGLTPLALPGNRGFAEAANAGARAARHSAVLLLNNDVTVEKGFLAPLVEHLGGPDVFCAACCMRDPERPRRVESITRLRWQMGFLDTLWPAPEEVERFPDGGEIFYACGGAALFRREPFLGLGGFETIYHPYYWEDVDLCYRAWKKGLRSVYSRNSVVWHKPGRTIEKTGTRSAIWRVWERNRLILQWRLISEPELFRSHLYWLARHVQRLARRREMDKLRAWAGSLGRLLPARRRLRRERDLAAFTDSELFARLSGGLPRG